MKKIVFFIFVLAFTLSSCDKESMGVSKITTYPTLELKGADVLFWEYGTPFVDPGCKGMEGETDISDNISVVSDIDVNNIGRYHMTYKVLNSDGFAATINRLVYVYKSSDPRNGMYKSAVTLSYKGAAYTSRGPWASSIMVLGNGTDKLWIEDLIGGWYYIGSGYGIDYATAGVITLDSASPNNVTALSGVEALPWGYVAILKSDSPSSYDSTTKTLLLNVDLPDVPMNFRVTLSNPTPLN